MSVTKYYRAIYSTGNENEMEVFIGTDILSATNYAYKTSNLLRRLISISEYDDLDSAWNINNDKN